MASVVDETEVRYRRLIELGIALSAERNHDQLMEKILLGAKELTNADGGTLYLVSDDRREMRFAIMRNDTMAMALGGTTGQPIPFPPVRLVDDDGKPNHKHVAAAAALTGRTINIADAYDAAGFDFSGPRAFDARTGYRSQSFLTVPLKNHDGEVVGVLQLINARAADGTVVPFATEHRAAHRGAGEPGGGCARQPDAARGAEESLPRLPPGLRRRDRRQVALYRRPLPPRARADQHARPRRRRGRARPASPIFTMTDDEWYELEVAGGLHDCGKVTTREYVVDKATKLETIYNRIHEIRTRFEVVKRDAEIEYLRAVQAGGDEPALARRARRAPRRARRRFRLRRANAISAASSWRRRRSRGSSASPRSLGCARSTTGSASRGRRASAAPRRRRSFRSSSTSSPTSPSISCGTTPPPLAPDNPWGFIVKPPAHKFNLGELYNLTMRRGTLTEEERYHINDHIVQTIIMLEALPFPKTLRRVPEWAGGHHEKMDGTGYPRGLKREQMSIPARIMAIADIFEALTARDRPYKTREEAVGDASTIMARMSQRRATSTRTSSSCSSLRASIVAMPSCFSCPSRSTRSISHAIYRRPPSPRSNLGSEEKAPMS